MLTPEEIQKSVTSLLETEKSEVALMDFLKKFSDEDRELVINEVQERVTQRLAKCKGLLEKLPPETVTHQEIQAFIEAGEQGLKEINETLKEARALAAYADGLEDGLEEATAPCRPESSR
jgi:geranylgeranyl pyrophosphate synthase